MNRERELTNKSTESRTAKKPEKEVEREMKKYLSTQKIYLSSLFNNFY